MTSLLALFRSGTNGLPPARPVEFDGLTLPPSPNTCLVGPPEYTGPKHLTQPAYAMPPELLWARLNRVAAGFPRTWKHGEWPARHQGAWVERSVTMNYPDLIAAEVRPHPAGAALYLYSRSIFGWGDNGFNLARAQRWLAALATETQH